MFFRLKKTSTGQALQLVESFRNAEGKPRQRIVVSLGDVDIAQKYWKETGRAVEEALYGVNQPYLLAPCFPAELETWVGHIVKRIEREGKWSPVKRRVRHHDVPADHHPPEDITPSLDSPAAGVIDGVVAAKVSHTHTTSLGPVLAGLHAWNQLGMPELLAELGLGDHQRRTAAALVLNRLDEPVSEHAMPAWIESSSLPELLGGEFRARSYDAFYRIGDRLLASRDRIEAHLRQRQASCFNLQRTLLLYDLTNTHFEGICAANPKARRGRNKQKRHDCPQVVIGMVFDEFGFELAHRTFKGNMSDSRSLLETLEQLQAAGESFDLATGQRPLVVMVSGIATEANRQLLRENGFSYLVNDSRPSRAKWKDAFSADGFMTVPGRDPGQAVEVRTEVLETQCDEQDSNAGGLLRETLVFCRSAGRGDKESAIRSRAEERFLEDVDKLQVRVASKRLKSPDKIERAIGRVLAKHPRVARYYTVELADRDSDTPILRWTRDQETWDADEALDGCYVLRTNAMDLKTDEIWQLYMTLARAENGFRMLKGDLGLRPNYHQLEDRVDAHIFITVLAYQLLSHLEYSLAQTGDTRSWPTLRRILQTHCYTTVLLPTIDGTIHRLRRPGIPEPEQQHIYKGIGLHWQNLPTTDIVINAHRESETL